MAVPKAWLALLADPCSAPLSRPCYTGTDAGYLIRTTDVFAPTISVTAGANSVIPVDYAFQYTPWSLSTTTGAVIAGALKGANLTVYSNLGFTNFISASGAVRTFRPVASCLKWVPDGPYSTRQGSIGLLSLPTVTISTTTPATSLNTFLASCPSVSSHGSNTHEVRWVPTQEDETFTTVGISNKPGLGTISIFFSGVDATMNGAGNLASLNGRLEVVTVWEWQPAYTQDVTQNLVSPSPFTSQQVLSNIKDMAAFAYHGVSNAVFQAGYAGGQALLTAGFQTLVRRAPPLLLRN